MIRVDFFMQLNMETKKYKDLELWYLDGGGVPVYRYQGIPFTGIVEEYNEGDTVLLAENEYLNRFQEGWKRIINNLNN